MICAYAFIGPWVDICSILWRPENLSLSPSWWLLKMHWYSPISWARGETKIWVFPKIKVPQNTWLIIENPIKIHDVGVPLFLETPICFPIFSILFHHQTSLESSTNQPFRISPGWQLTVGILGAFFPFLLCSNPTLFGWKFWTLS